MKKCANENCELMIKDEYQFCYAHYQPMQTDMKAKAAGQWHTDPQVDVLLKMNANVGKLVQTLERLTQAVEFIAEVIEKQKGELHESHAED